MRNSENLTLRDSNKYISSLSFSSPDAKSLKGARIWEDIPDFCVITGPNGSGKSHLLEYINRCLLNKEGTKDLPGRHVYLQANDDEMLPSYHQDQAKSKDLNAFWIEVDNKRKKDESLDFLRERFIQGKFLRDEKPEKIDKFLEDLRNLFERANHISDIRQAFDDLVGKHFPYFIAGTPGDRSISLLNSIFNGYHARVEKIMKEKNKASELLAYAQKNRAMLFPKYSDDFEMIGDFANIEDEVEDKYIASKIQEELGCSPLKEINDILEDHNFTFEIKESKDGIRLLRRDESLLEIEPKDLSSGEKKILEMLGWLYYYLSDKIFEGRRVSIMLLDEPDRHLDPKFLAVFLDIIFNKFVKSNKKVQVIMITHRPDTITLIPEESIFLLHRDNNSCQIVHASRNSVLRRLTQNLQNYTRTSTKVYTEGTTDADFYCGAYYSLVSCSNEQISMNQNQLIFRDNKGRKISKSLLSREYPLLFVPSSHTIGDGGGYNSVYTCVLRDKNILVSKSKEKQDKIEPISDPQAFNSLGIIDNDNNQHEKEVIKKQLDKRVAIPKVRYSIENFAIDPIILCQVLTPERASDYINCLVEKSQSSKNGKSEEKKTPETGDSGTGNTDRENIVSEKKKIFGSICEKIKKELDMIIQNLQASEDYNIDVQNLENCLEEYFNFIAPIYEKLEKDSTKDSSKTNRKQILCSKFEETHEKFLKKIEDQKASGVDVEWVRASFGELSNSLKPILSDFVPKGQKVEPLKLPEGNDKINILILKGLNKFITVEYPLKFLKMNGHDLVLGLNPFVEQNSKLIQEITNNVYTSGLTFIQEELVDVILELNEFAKDNSGL